MVNQQRDRAWCRETSLTVFEDPSAIRLDKSPSFENCQDDVSEFFGVEHAEYWMQAVSDIPKGSPDVGTTYRRRPLEA
jgi:hypothetical protein